MAERVRPLPVRTTVRRVERLTPALIRVVVGGDDLARFADPVHADSYVKIVFLHPDATYDRPIDPAAIRERMPQEHWARLRAYTVRAFHRARGALTLDVVVHGASGLGGPWAAAAREGDEVFVQGPGGGYTPSPDADWHLLAGDESALPAIAVALERMPPGALVQALVEVHGAEDELDLAGPVTWLHRGDRPVGEQLVGAVRAWPVPAGRGHAFVHGEAGAVKALRRYLRIERGMSLDDLSISGYWRLGVDDEGWRRVKRDWNREVEEAERGDAGLP